MLRTNGSPERYGMLKSRILRCAVLICYPPLLCVAQKDPLQAGATELSKKANQKLVFHLEERTRWEERTGNNFGAAKNQQDMLSRIRIGMDYKPSKWLTLSGMGQDARAPWYGPNAPSSHRDSFDLQEAWVNLGTGKSLNFSAGRRMLTYGEGRVIGVPQWTNTSRTFDHGRVKYSYRKVTADLLFLSPVIVRPDEFNRPDLGNRYWGVYNTVPSLWKGMSIDFYALRHSQNKIGGWTGAGTLGTNSYGIRFYGPLPSKVTYSLEGIAQNGHTGVAAQRAYAWFVGISRPATAWGIPIELSAEIKAASGSHLGETHSSTYDQLTPANHDKFGHEDLFGWKNLRTFKTLETLHPTKPLALNLMYTNEWLYSASDALYNSSGSVIALSKPGIAGHHVGQELDVFTTYSWGPHTFLAGFGHFFRGSFVENTTPRVNPRYFYIAQQYTIK